jgi:hydrogenase/urease accessory protein HupE
MRKIVPFLRRMNPRNPKKRCFVFMAFRRLYLIVVISLLLLAGHSASAHNLPMGGSRWCFGKHTIIGNIDLSSSLLGEIEGIKEGHIDLGSLSDEQLQHIATVILQPYIDKKLSIMVDGRAYPVRITRLARNSGTYSIWLSADHIGFDEPVNQVRIDYQLLFEETDNTHINLAFGYLSDATGASLQKVFDFSPPAFQTTFDHNAPVWELAINGTAKAAPEPKPEAVSLAASASAATADHAARHRKIAAPFYGAAKISTGTHGVSTAGLKSSASSPGASYPRSAQTCSSPGQPAARSVWSAVGQFLVLGIEHILTGYDHIAFLLALIVIGLSLKEVLKTITAFTTAHSITLLLAALRIVSLNSRFVESAIALSICYVAAENLFRQEVNYRWLVTFGFGLVHGFGFASALQELIVGRANLLLSVVSFNMGVEIGQLMIISVMLPVLYLLKKQFQFRIISTGVSAAIFLVGFTWLIERVFDLKVLTF